MSMLAPIVQQIIDDAWTASQAEADAALAAEQAAKQVVQGQLDAANAQLQAILNAPGYSKWTGPGWFDASDLSTLMAGGGLANKRTGGGDLTYAGIANSITAVANGQNGLNILRVVRDVSTLSSAPRLGANPSDRVSAMFAGNDQPYTVIAAYKPTDANSGFIWSASDRTDATNVQNIALVRRITPSSIRRQIGTTQSDVNFGSGQVAGTPVIVAVRHTGAKTSVWNNSLTKTVDGAAQDVSSLTGSLSFRLFAAETVGASDPAIAQAQCNLDFYECVIEDAARSEADIQQAITAIAAKWAIVLS